MFKKHPQVVLKRAIPRLGLPAYAPDDGPLTEKQVRALRKDATKHLPKGKVLASAALFA